MIDPKNYENRPFVWGKHDCFGLVRDLYRDWFQIEIRDYARPTDWRSDAMNLVVDLYEQEGFEMVATWRLKDLRPGDVMAMAVGESNPNHMAVYLGGNEFIHHLYGHLSAISPMKGHWLHSTCFLLRHPSVPDLRPVPKPTHLEDLLRARHKVQAAPEA